ncbi:Ceramidase [Rubripirellula lacrimiformis]|uniref:Ceramidase n=1 Tax=Rubripirellula lacrimiformis TaxID=1930273 RepID=A0A517N7A7_9BACT|nr:ceramidase domain-containing protein [Rubripirellula lacrimiformis]QDT03026.1 Ceramidase [Rubripirellula lacrimiformis]
MNETLDLYCERCSDGVWAEPINAISNVSFLIAAWLAYRYARRHAQLDRSIRIMIGLAGAIAIGSALFHTFATRWAQALDVLPIFAFQIGFLWLYLRNVAGLCWQRCFAACSLLIVTTLLAAMFPQFINGSLMYVPAYLSLAGLTLLHHWHDRPAGRWMFGTLAGLTIALIFRTIDIAVCAMMPLGTHFLWHLINGFVIYASMRVLLARDQRIHPIRIPLSSHETTPTP